MTNDGEVPVIKPSIAKKEMSSILSLALVSLDYPNDILEIISQFRNNVPHYYNDRFDIFFFMIYIVYHLTY